MDFQVIPFLPKNPAEKKGVLSSIEWNFMDLGQAESPSYLTSIPWNESFLYTLNKMCAVLQNKGCGITEELHDTSFRIRSLLFIGDSITPREESGFF